MKHHRYVDHDKRRQRKVLIFSLIMIGLMVFSVAEVILYQRGNDGNQMKYGQYEFAYKDFGNGRGVLTTEINGQEIEFQSLPTQAASLDVDPKAIALIKGGSQVILTTDTNLTQQDAATVDYARLQLGLAIPKTVNAITGADENYNLPVVNCSLAKPEMPVLLFNISNETSLKAYGDCIVLNGEELQILLLKDRIIYEYYGILNNGVVVE